MRKAWLWALAAAAMGLVSPLPVLAADIICLKDSDCSPPLNPCTVARCDLVLGCNIVDADGIPCDDGNLCTGQGTCLGGVCQGGAPIACPPTDQCHTAGTCDPSTGRCSNPAQPNGMTCNDSNACTRADTC